MKDLLSIRCCTPPVRYTISVLLLVVLSGCESDLATSVIAAQGSPVPLVATPEQISAARMDLLDASERLAPAVDDSASELGEALRGARRALEHDDARALTISLRQIARATSILAARADQSQAADLDAVRSALVLTSSLVATPDAMMP